MSMPEQLKEKILELMVQAQEGKHVQCVQRIMELLRGSHLVYESTISPRFVHVHPQNRDGTGVNPTSVKELFSDILAAGWDSTEVKPVCCEVSSKELSAVTAFNEMLHDQAKGMLAPVEAGSVKFASVSASHTNQTLRVLHYQFNAQLTLDQLKQEDSNFHKAATSGLTWQVISHEVTSEFPDLPSLVQQTYNTGSQLQKGETELQMARRILSMLSEVTRAQTYEQVHARIARTKPACLPSLPHIWKFAMQFGNCKEWLRQIETATKTSVPRTLGPEVWEAVCREFKSGDFIQMRRITLQLAYMAPDKLIGHADVRRFFSLQSLRLLQEADGMCQKMQKLAEAAHLPNCDEVLHFQRAVVALKMGKKHPDVTGNAETMEQAAAVCVRDVKERTGKILSDEWKDHLPEPIGAARGSKDEEKGTLCLAIANLCLL